MSKDSALTNLKLNPFDANVMVRFVGELNENLKFVEKTYNVKIFQNGDSLKIKGLKKNTELSADALIRLYETAGQGFEITKETLHLCTQESSDKNITQTTVIKTPKKSIIPRGINQKEYVNNIYNNEINFGIGPAGTGKTYLAVAAAVDALLNEKVERIVLIRPAVDGTLRVLNACSKADVKKVVLTSSVAAVAYGHDSEKIFDESDWSNTGGESGITPYAKSKTLAEKAAWEFVNKLAIDNKFDFTVINPVGVFGPMLTNDMGTSNSLVSKLINGELPACPATHMGYVDVRDVAKAHIFSMLNSSTNGKRIIVSESEMFFVDVGRILNDAGFKKSPTKQMPNWLVKFLALFIKELSGVTKSLGKRVDTDKSLAKSLFDWEYISAKDSIIDTAEQLSTSDHN